MPSFVTVLGNEILLTLAHVLLERGAGPPNILHIGVVPDLSPNLFEQVERGSLDAAVLSEPKRIPTNLNWMPFYEEELMLLTSPEVTEIDPLRSLASMPTSATPVNLPWGS